MTPQQKQRQDLARALSCLTFYPLRTVTLTLDDWYVFQFQSCLRCCFKPVWVLFLHLNSPELECTIWPP